MNKIILILLLCVTGFSCIAHGQQQIAEKPLFRDPIDDGAADPVVIWNKQEKCWYMFYTGRRAKLENGSGVEWVHGTYIGIAKSTNGGASWSYVGKADIRYGDKNYSFWAPDVVQHGGKYHMFLTVVPGTFADWKHPREIVHLTSNDLVRWDRPNKMNLASDKVIDAAIFKAHDGWWYMYYNNEKDRKSIYSVKTKDFKHWTDAGKIIGDQPGEGPKVFFWQGRYWMVVDNWRGLGVYSSSDLKSWTRQTENILAQPGNGEDDATKGLHADVIINDGKAYIFYFTHPDRVVGVNEDNYKTRRSSIQVAELKLEDGKICCDRDKPLLIYLKAPKQ